MPPIGPLGAHMKLSPKTTPSEAKLIEYVLRNLLRTFITDNFEDKRYFDLDYANSEKMMVKAKL